MIIALAIKCNICDYIGGLSLKVKIIFFGSLNNVVHQHYTFIYSISKWIYSSSPALVEIFTQALYAIYNKYRNKKNPLRKEVSTAMSPFDLQKAIL